MQDHRPETVLEIGTGSGFQCAILAQLVRRVYSVERIEALLANILPTAVADRH